MPGPASGRYSLTTRCAARSPVVQPSQSVGASGPASTSRSDSAARSVLAQFLWSVTIVIVGPERRGGNNCRSWMVGTVEAEIDVQGEPVPQKKVERDILRAGFGVLWVAIRAEPRLFCVSLVASAVYAGTTVASASVLGWATQHVVLPAFKNGHTSAGVLWTGALAIMGVAVLKALGVAGRRLYAGMMQYRAQATYRRKVTARYLALPLRWHQAHPTGQLLSVANSDVEQTWDADGAVPDVRRRDRHAPGHPRLPGRHRPDPCRRRRRDLSADRRPQRGLPAGAWHHS